MPLALGACLIGALLGCANEEATEMKEVAGTFALRSPDRFANRLLYVHNPNVTLMRTTPEECVRLGEIIAGIEPIERTLEAIDYITSLGAFPTVCVFRPTVDSDMAGWPPPGEADIRRVMAHVYAACRRHWIPIGAAPNIEVSLVVNPDDTVYLAEPGLHTTAYEWYRRAVKLAAAPLFKRRMRPRRAA